MSSLTAADLEMFARLGVGPDLLERAGIARVSDAEARRDCKLVGPGDMSGIAFPYFLPGGDRNVMVYCRVRRDHPEITEDGRPQRKYMGPPSSESLRPHPYFPPGAQELIADVTTPIILIEAEKSALSLSTWSARTGRKIAAVGLGGCWAWRARLGTRTIGKKKTAKQVPIKGIHPDLRICKGRVTYVLLDSNTSTNARVLVARRALTTELRDLGADVRILDLPGGVGINGPDDFLAAHGDQALSSLLDQKKNAGTVLDAVEKFLRKYVVMSDAQYCAVVLWAAYTWAPEVSDFTPYLHVSSPEKQSGKTRVFELLQLLVRRPWRTTGASGATLFRQIDHLRPTLLFDELDGLLKGNQEKSEDVRMILNEGFRREGTVARCVGKDFIVKNFRVGGAKGLAGIGQLWDTVRDRSIPIKLQRKLAGQKLSRFRERSARLEAMLLQDQLATWVESQLPALNTAMDLGPEVPAKLSDRQKDSVEILCVLADLAGGEWPGRSRKALAEIFAAEDVGDDSVGMRVLVDLRDLFNQEPAVEVFSTDSLLMKLANLEASPWSDWARGKGLTRHALAKLLKPYRVFSGRHMDKGERVSGYRRSDLEDAWSRYLPPSPVMQSANVAEASVHAGLEPILQSGRDPLLPDLKSEVSSSVYAGPATLADYKQGDMANAPENDSESGVEPAKLDIATPSPEPTPLATTVAALRSRFHYGEPLPPTKAIPCPPEVRAMIPPDDPEPPLPAISPEMLAESETIRSYFMAAEAAWRADPYAAPIMPDTSTMIPFLVEAQIELTDEHQIFYGEPPDLRPGRGCDVGAADDEQRKRRERAKARRRP